jgi:hypothetical protein
LRLDRIDLLDMIVKLVLFTGMGIGISRLYWFISTIGT